MKKETDQAVVTQPAETRQEAPDLATADTRLVTPSIIIALLVILLLVLLGLPITRDWLLTFINNETRAWLFANKQILSAWIDWLRILFEVALGLLISNQVFNDSFRKWFETSMNATREKWTNKIEESIKRNDARVKIRNKLSDIFVVVIAPGRLRDLPGDLIEVYKAYRALSDEVSSGMAFLFIRLAGLKALQAFSGQLHASAACLSFVGVLLMKILRLYLDSPVLSPM